MAQPTVIKDLARRSEAQIGVITGVLLAGLGTALASVLFGATNRGAPEWIFGAFFVAIVGYGLTWIISGSRDLWRSHVLGVLVLTIPGEEPLFLDAVAVARFHRSGGTRRARGPARLSADLVCEEQVSYEVGQGLRVATHQVHRHKLQITSAELPDVVSGELVIDVPRNGPPSLALNRNKIVWSVKVQVQVPGVPDDTGTFAITVRPALAANALSDREPSDREPGALS